MHRLRLNNDRNIGFPATLCWTRKGEQRFGRRSAAAMIGSAVSSWSNPCRRKAPESVTPFRGLDLRASFAEGPNLNVARESGRKTGRMLARS